MCKLCNESLQAAAHSASMLATAAKALYDMNDHINSKVLADAAAELFTKVKVVPKTGDVSPNQSKPAEDAAQPEQAPGDERKRPQGFFFDDENGVVYINGVALGRVVLIDKPIKH